MKKIIKKLLYIYIGLILGFILMGQALLEHGILTKSKIHCQEEKCKVAESYLTGKPIRQFSFKQKDVANMWLQEDFRGYYNLWSSFDKITDCSNCGDLNLIHLPFSWWWKTNAESFIHTLKTKDEVQYTQYNRLFSWLGTVITTTIILIFGLYKLGKIK
ncbi:MAG: hypothetical protein IJ660_01845 [Alphaproteobacteria bacterium]|nr:hypothetical protein [Alphaproteobacteria bacterium]